MMHTPELAVRLRTLRARYGYTLEEAGELAGLRAATIAEAERARVRPRAATLAKLADLYSVPVEELMELALGKARARETGRPDEDEVELLEARNTLLMELDAQEGQPLLATPTAYLRQEAETRAAADVAQMIDELNREHERLGQIFMDTPNYLYSSPKGSHLRDATEAQRGRIRAYQLACMELRKGYAERYYTLAAVASEKKRQEAATAEELARFDAALLRKQRIAV